MEYQRQEEQEGEERKKGKTRKNRDEEKCNELIKKIRKKINTSKI